MGTKLQFAINPLATASNNSFVVNQLSDWGYSQEIAPRNHLKSSALNHFKYSMTDIFDFQNIECIRKTMLMHEDIFNRQVRELHRLYDRQMKLMYELKNEMKHNRGALTAKDMNTSEFAILHQPMRDIKSNLPVHGLRGDPQERSGSCSAETPRMAKGFGLERLEEDPSTTIRGIEQDQKGCNSSRHTNDNEMNVCSHDEEIDVELTLSIGRGSGKKRLKNQLNPSIGSSDSNCKEGELCSSSLFKRDAREDIGAPSPAVSSTTATLNHNVARSNWIFQDLSLNRK